MTKKKSIFIVIIILVIDQLTKAIMIDKQIILIPRFIQLRYTQNTGMAFSLGSGNVWIIILLSLAIIAIIIKILVDKKDKMTASTLISLELILSGAISNLIDRVFRGYVVDFIDVSLFNFPTFNIADISITIGVLLLIINVLRQIDYNKGG